MVAVFTVPGYLPPRIVEHLLDLCKQLLLTISLRCQ